MGEDDEAWARPHGLKFIGEQRMRGNGLWLVDETSRAEPARCDHRVDARPRIYIAGG